MCAIMVTTAVRLLPLSVTCSNGFVMVCVPDPGTIFASYALMNKNQATTLSIEKTVLIYSRCP